MKDKLPVRRPVNMLQNIIQDFLEGAPFTEQLCNKVAATYEMEHSGVQVSYKKHLEYLKTVLNRGQNCYLGNGVHAVKLDFDPNEFELALIIRFLNLSHHGSRVIVLNEQIIYIPKALRHHTEEEIRRYTYRVIQGVKPNRLSIAWSNYIEKRYRKQNKTVPIQMELATA